ncbi:Uncharacterized protein FWK35_00030611 [Aphis craccivora]|uniref:Uncharacterized protein n=1 Tax=Aphis craccivora TaxID=307492 RepID=A0A6G0Z5A5_APHCR|nr:Uncharacterized protein FWK35_00030611 [Aphis craccivora]
MPPSIHFYTFNKESNKIVTVLNYLQWFVFELQLNKKTILSNSGLHSERSDECIDFTMIITSRKNAPISNYGGGFRCKSEYPWCIIEVKS